MFPGCSEGRTAFSGHAGAAGSKALHLASTALIGEGHRTSTEMEDHNLYYLGIVASAPSGLRLVQLLHIITSVMNMFTLFYRKSQRKKKC